MSESSVFAAPSAPGNNASVDLFNSVTAFGGGMMRMLGLDMVEISFHLLDQASATNGLKLSTSTDKGVTWTQSTVPDDAGTATMPLTVSSLAANAQRSYRFVVSGYPDVKITYTAGATGPTATTGWGVSVVGYFGAVAMQR